MTERTARDWALTYAAMGWRVFPVVPGGKRPIYTGWQRDATTNPELIVRYWRTEPGPNIGIVTGEAFVAFDVEAAHLPRLRTWIEAQGHRLPPTPIARTGRGGIHLLVRASTSCASHVLRLDGVHIGELKAAGGFIVACPSRTEGPYGWIRSPEDVELLAAPGWLAGLAVERTASQPRAAASTQPLSPSRAVALMAGLYRVVSTAPEGDRNALLFWASCRVAEHGVDTQAAAEILLAAAKRAGLPEREALATIASGWGR